MGYVKDLHSNPDPRSFPDAKFEVEGNVPGLQCQEALISSETAFTTSAPNKLIDAGAFVGHDLTGKKCHITESPGGNPGTKIIASNTDSELTLNQDPGESGNVHYYLSNGGGLVFLRDMQSFAEFISAAGYSYTIKGGKLSTNMPDLQIENACTAHWNPL